MPDYLAGTTVLAADTPPAVSAAQGGSYDATTTAYDVTTTAGTYADCAVVFTAPTSGRVLIHTAMRAINSATSGSLVAPETRLGSTIGVGTVVEAAADNIGCASYGTTFQRQGATHLLTGLTAGASYNTRLLHRASAGTATFANRELIVSPTS
jgi:hypothetical protein